MSQDTAILVLLVSGLALFIVSFAFWWEVFMAARAARRYFDRENARIERQFRERG